MQLRKKDIAAFQRNILSFWSTHKRNLPWRDTRDPYHIWISEVMLQQTQVDRVIPKYRAFVERFPTISKLSRARLRSVLLVWQGLGYNRRAKYVHDGARYLQKNRHGMMPHTLEELKTIPSIGPYTAAAICNFAYNTKAICIETNIRTVYLHHFFLKGERVSDKEILEFVDATFYTKDPRTWMSALMDYGAFLKRAGIKNNKQSTGYTKQSAFKGSVREIRGQIIRLLLTKPFTMSELCRGIPAPPSMVRKQVNALVVEGLVTKKSRQYYSI